MAWHVGQAWARGQGMACWARGQGIGTLGTKACAPWAPTHGMLGKAWAPQGIGTKACHGGQGLGTLGATCWARHMGTLAPSDGMLDNHGHQGKALAPPWH